MSDYQAYLAALRQQQQAQAQSNPNPNATGNANNNLHTYTYHPQPNAATPANPAQAPVYCYPQAVAPAGPAGPMQYAYYPWQAYYQPQAANPAAVQYAPHPYYYLPQPAAVAAAAPAPAAPQNNQHVWVGRTAAQVEEDNQRMAWQQGVNQPNEFQPRNPGDDQLFWVLELDGSRVLRNFQTIENTLRPGRWMLDPAHGNCFFVRQAPT